MLLETVYVTVGTTKFDALIAEVASKEVLHVLRECGCRRLILQVGQGKSLENVDEIQKTYGIEVEQYDFKLETPRSDILRSDLVIGHAGAGTCMDILKHGRPGLIVINEGLMDNHQTELALQLCDDGYLYYCDVSHLAQSLSEIDARTFRKYESESNISKLVLCINQMMMS